MTYSSIHATPFWADLEALDVGKRVYDFKKLHIENELPVYRIATKNIGC